MRAVNVHEAGPYNPNAQAWVDACVEAGYPLRTCNAEDIVTGSGWLPMNRRGAHRVSTAMAYLRRRPDNLTVRTETFVRRILIDDNGAAVGVETDRGEAHAGIEVIVSAGVFNSPKLLMLSGIGPAAHLREVGLDVKVDLPAVGGHISDHVETILVYASPQPVRATYVQSCEAAAWVKTAPALSHYDVFVHHVSDGYWVDGTDLGLPPFEAVAHAWTMTPYLARPHSKGTVRLRSADPAAPPVIDPRYFMDPQDADITALVGGIRICRDIARQPALAPWVTHEVLPGPALQGDAELAAYARKTANSEYHWAGGCRIGDAADEGAVVGPDLRVRGVERLRVADASILPDQPGVNPALTVMMIGEKCADLVRQATSPAVARR